MPMRAAIWPYMIHLLMRIAAFGVAGLSIAVDSLSAIKFGKVKPVRNEEGIAIDFEVLGDFPKYGNDDDRVDDMAVEIVSYFSAELKKHALYREQSTHFQPLQLQVT